MKIGLVCPYSINRHGGVLAVVLALHEGLTKRGHDVKLITPMPRGGDSSERPDAIFIGSSTDFRAPSHTTGQVSSITDTDKVDKILAAENFDILHFHEPWVPLLSRQLLQRSKALNIGTFHSKIPETFMSRTYIKVVTPYLKSVMKYLDVLTAVSESGAEYASMLTDLPITIIPNGIDLTKYKRNRSKTKPIILYIGRLERRKGAKYLLHAFKLFSQQNPSVKLLIAGDGPDREKLELLAEDLKLKNVKFLGFISEETKLKLLNEAALFCSPALFGESFGIVLLEAMATSTVCVAGNNSGYIGLMHGVGGLSIVNPEDTPEFARRLDLLLHETSLRKIWKSWAHNYVKQFDYPIVIDQYEKLYKDSLKKYG
jgi:phosphatidylinositol alpha-mannosyltransferase